MVSQEAALCNIASSPKSGCAGCKAAEGRLVRTWCEAAKRGLARKQLQEVGEAFRSSQACPTGSISALSALMRHCTPHHVQVEAHAPPSSMQPT